MPSRAGRGSICGPETRTRTAWTGRGGGERGGGQGRGAQALLLGARDAEPGFAPGIRLRGAYVVGRLDLMGASVNWPLVCEHCVFGGEIRLVESSTRTVRIVHSVVPGFNGTRMRLDGILNLWGCAVAGVVRLDQAKVTGQVCLRTMDVGASAAGTEAVPAASRSTGACSSTAASPRRARSGWWAPAWGRT